jgi:hypothetical protein
MQGSAGFRFEPEGELVKNGSEQGYGMAGQNAYQVAAWNGQSAERWVAYQARLDAMMAVFGQAAVEAAAPATGERVLDVGAARGRLVWIWPPASARGAMC